MEEIKNLKNIGLDTSTDTQEELIKIRMEIINVLKSHQESFEILLKDLETYKTLH